MISNVNSSSLVATGKCRFDDMAQRTHLMLSEPSMINWISMPQGVRPGSSTIVPVRKRRSGTGWHVVQLNTTKGNILPAKKLNVARSGVTTSTKGPPFCSTLTVYRPGCSNRFIGMGVTVDAYHEAWSVVARQQHDCSGQRVPALSCSQKSKGHLFNLPGRRY